MGAMLDSTVDTYSALVSGWLLEEFHDFLRFLRSILVAFLPVATTAGRSARSAQLVFLWSDRGVPVPQIMEVEVFSLCVTPQSSLCYPAPQIMDKS